MTDDDYRVSVYRPLLPPADAVAAYIRQSDAARFYANRGPLVCQLEARLSAAFGQDDAVRLTASGTAAIEAAILAQAGPARPEKPVALVPSYTFAATALAAERCGYRVVLTDIARETWCLEAEACPRGDEIGLVLPVAAYGRMPDLDAWSRFRADTGIPVVIDAAAATEALMDRPDLIRADLPLTLSFHATKTFSTGEGGAVVWSDADGLARIEQVSNFGFHYSRECKMAGLNAKMSDYHAAVGLAMLDDFPARRQAYAGIVARYRDAVRGLPGRLHLPPDLASVYVLWEAPDAASHDRVEAAMDDNRIETRRWYEAGLHVQPHFRSAARPDLPVTQDLSGRLLGLPMSHDLPAERIARIARVLAEAA